MGSLFLAFAPILTAFVGIFAAEYAEHLYCSLRERYVILTA